MIFNHYRTITQVNDYNVIERLISIEIQPTVLYSVNITFTDNNLIYKIVINNVIINVITNVTDFPK